MPRAKGIPSSSTFFFFMLHKRFFSSMVIAVSECVVRPATTNLGKRPPTPPPPNNITLCFPIYCFPLVPPPVLVVFRLIPRPAFCLGCSWVRDFFLGFSGSWPVEADKFSQNTPLFFSFIFFFGLSPFLKRFCPLVGNRVSLFLVVPPIVFVPNSLFFFFLCPPPSVSTESFPKCGRLGGFHNFSVRACVTLWLFPTTWVLGFLSPPQPERCLFFEPFPHLSVAGSRFFLPAGGEKRSR